MNIHPTAIVSASAEIASDVQIGPYAIVGDDVKIERGCKLAAHTHVVSKTHLGENNVVHSFAVLGDAPQDKRHGDSATCLVIGANNVFREHVTVHRGTRDTATRIGSNNLFMAQSHVAHDVTIGSHCIVANAVQLAGHVQVGDYAAFGGLAGVAQFVHIGESAFVAAGSMVERHVPPFLISQGDRARVRAVNRVGLERRQLTRETIAEITRIFRAIYLNSAPRSVTLLTLTTTDPFAQKLLDALRK